MDVQEVLRNLGLILGAGLCAGPVAALLRMPQMIVLVAIGALIGPSALGIAENPLTGLGAQLIFTVGVSVILFHGGTGISLRVLSRTAVGLGLLVLPGVLLSAVLVALVVAPLFGVGFDVALMIGAVLAATDPAILIPLFDRLRLRPKVAQTVIAESAFNDPTATVLALDAGGDRAVGRRRFRRAARRFHAEPADRDGLRHRRRRRAGRCSCRRTARASGASRRLRSSWP